MAADGDATGLGKLDHGVGGGVVFGSTVEFVGDPVNDIDNYAFFF